MSELADKLEDYKQRISSAMVRLDIPAKQKQLAELEKQSMSPDFWQDSGRAQDVMRLLAETRKTVERWREMEQKVIDITELISLVPDGEESSLDTEIRQEMDAIESRLDQMEFELAFGGEYDNRNAILSIHAGAGGVESQDWAEMLVRMYLRWAERKKYKAEVLDISPGEEAGIKNVILEISSEYAFGYLKSEHGVHRLVRLSPFDSDHARHTSFALVEVMPEAGEEVDINISSDDLKVETFRSSGPGGQNMQKTSSAVRITHIPSGTVVSCQSERSQFQNKDSAMKILLSRLLNQELAKKEEERAKLKGKRIVAGWSNQIRSYVLHPYKMVKDHRTDYQVGDAESVLSGDLDGFINAYLRAGLGDEDD
ncbi:MAG: peptide chain release factor 2 [Dehalococcoidales bacterium]|nr:peptide chain release factor 2 [Dehalococcoidales bacterium]